MQLDYLARPTLLRQLYGGAGVPTVGDLMGATTSAEFHWIGGLFMARMAAASRRWRQSGARRRSAVFLYPQRWELADDFDGLPPLPRQLRSARWLTPAAEDGRGLVCEHQLLQLLSLQWSSLFGSVRRATGDYDVLIVTRGTVGHALDKQGWVVAAED